MLIINYIYMYIDIYTVIRYVWTELLRLVTVVDPPVPYA